MRQSGLWRNSQLQIADFGLRIEESEISNQELFQLCCDKGERIWYYLNNSRIY